MQMIIVTGSERTTTGLGAAATATALAADSRKTLLASLGPIHILGGLFGQTTGPQPQPTPSGFDLWLPDSLERQGALWEERRKVVGGSAAAISSDELPTVPGSDLFITLHLLREQMERYDAVVLDAGDYGALLRALALPDGFRWGLRLLLGLDRGPGRSTQSQARALVPTALLPFEWLGQVQGARVEVEELRDTTSHANGTSVVFVLPPDAPSLTQAQAAVPALQLYGLAVAALMVGPLLPADIGDERLAVIAADQQSLLAQVQEQWTPRPLLTMPPATATIEGLQSLADEVYASVRPQELFRAEPPVKVLAGPTVALSLPLLQQGALRLTISGDELILQIGPYRRHMLLPDGLRGVAAIKATRLGNEIVITQRNQ